MRSAEIFAVVSHNGRQLDAHTAMKTLTGDTTLVFESGSGTRGAVIERNVDYSSGQSFLLSPTGSIRLQLDDAVFATR